MEWKYVKPLSSNEMITEFETAVKYKFDDEFKKCIINHNGGRPSFRKFNTDSCKERELKSFLSFNREDRETVWKINDWNKEELSDLYIAFAIDNFGNLICFDRQNNNVIFFNHENNETELISLSFSDFLKKLY